jgi:hypothetical protein
MWVKDKDTQEGYVHVCKGKRLTDMKTKKLVVSHHRVINYITLLDKNGIPDVEFISFCPYCGVDLMKEEFSN